MAGVAGRGKRGMRAGTHLVEEKRDQFATAILTQKEKEDLYELAYQQRISVAEILRRGYYLYVDQLGHNGKV